jgi:hypothetical protein
MFGVPGVPTCMVLVTNGSTTLSECAAIISPEVTGVVVRAAFPSTLMDGGTEWPGMGWWVTALSTVPLGRPRWSAPKDVATVGCDAWRLTRAPFTSTHGEPKAAMDTP